MPFLVSHLLGDTSPLGVLGAVIFIIGLAYFIIVLISRLYDHEEGNGDKQTLEEADKNDNISNGNNPNQKISEELVELNGPISNMKPPQPSQPSQCKSHIYTSGKH